MEKYSEVGTEMNCFEDSNRQRGDFLENLTSSAEPAEVLAGSISRLSAVLKVDSGFVYLFDPEQDIYNKVSIPELDSNSPFLPMSKSLPTHTGQGDRLLFHMKMLACEPLVLSDVELGEDTISTELSQIFKSTVGIALFPMKIGNRLTGMTGFKSVSRPLIDNKKAIAYVSEMTSVLGLFTELHREALSANDNAGCESEPCIISMDMLGNVLDVGSELAESLSWTALDAKGHHILDLIKPKFHHRIIEEFYETLSCLRKEIVVPLNISEGVQLYQVHPVIVDQRGMKLIEFCGHKVRSIGD